MLAMHTPHLAPPMASCKEAECPVAHLSVHVMRVSLLVRDRMQREARTSNSAWSGDAT